MSGVSDSVSGFDAWSDVSELGASTQSEKSRDVRSESASLRFKSRTSLRNICTSSTGARGGVPPPVRAPSGAADEKLQVPLEDSD